MFKLERILAIGAHPDDIELGCGGSIAKFTDRGVQVCAVVLTAGAKGNRTSADRLEETTRALRALGVTNIRIEDFPDTALFRHLDELIVCLEKHANDICPDRVYTMFEHDRHQDHRTTFEASVAACRSAKQILCYETPSSWMNFQPGVFEDIGGTLDRKINALSLHVSQKDRQYTQPDAMRANAFARGVQVGMGPVEAFIGYKFIL